MGHYVAVDKETGQAYAKGKHLYEIEIPDPVQAKTPTGSNYLEEADFLEKETVITLFEPLQQWKGMDQDTFQDLMSQLKNSERKYFGVNESYHIIARVLGDNEQASKYLNALGYDGIHFFGGDDGEAYVIFDDDKLEIKKHSKL